MSDRIMYVKPACPYCQAARESMSAQGIDWEERDATTSAEWKRELYEHSPQGVVPTVVSPDGVTVGWEGRG
jgi:glutaredoxin